MQRKTGAASVNWVQHFNVRKSTHHPKPHHALFRRLYTDLCALVFSKEAAQKCHRLLWRCVTDKSTEFANRGVPQLEQYSQGEVHSRYSEVVTISPCVGSKVGQERGLCAEDIYALS